VIVGSGFGGSVAALRAAEKGYRVGVMESGRRWNDEDIPKSQWDLPHFLWFPAAELYVIQRVEYLDDVLVLSGGRGRRLPRPRQHPVRPPAVGYRPGAEVVRLGPVARSRSLLDADPRPVALDSRG
jgi:choline dehydrogenase-like flavoprotein